MPALPDLLQQQKDRSGPGRNRALWPPGWALSEGAFAASFLDPADGTIRLKPNGDCVFLDEHGCGIHPARPLVCRLFPLGIIWDETGRERFGLMPLHPDCLGYMSDEGTVEEYLESEGANPGLAAERSIRMKIR